MKIVIAKVDEVLFEGDAYSLTVPGADGEMTVLGSHMPLITTLKPGVAFVRMAPNSEPQTFPISGGVLEINSLGAIVIL